MVLYAKNVEMLLLKIQRYILCKMRYVHRELLVRGSWEGTQVGLAGRWESPYSTSLMWTHRVR